MTPGFPSGASSTTSPPSWPTTRSKRARQDYAAAHGAPFRMILAPEPPVDPLGDPEGTAAFLASYVALGATGFCLRFAHQSLHHYCEQMAAMVDVAPRIAP